MIKESIHIQIPRVEGWEASEASTFLPWAQCGREHKGFPVPSSTPTALSLDM